MCSQLHVNHLANTLWKFKQENLFCDTTIFLQNGLEVLAHSAVLGAVSVKLKIALQGQCGKYQLFLADCEPYLLDVVLRYIYTGVVEDSGQMSCDEVGHLTATYEKLGISGIQSPTVDYDETEDAENSGNGHLQDGEEDCNVDQHFKTTANGGKQKSDVHLGNSIIDSPNAEMTLSKEIALFWQAHTTPDLDPGGINTRPESGTDSEKTLEDDKDDVTEQIPNKRQGRMKLPQKTVILTKPLETIKTRGIKCKNVADRSAGELADVKDVVVKTEAVEQSWTALESGYSASLKPSTRQRRNGGRTRTSKTKTTHSVQCQLCSKSFTRKAHLLDHLRSHTTMKPYVCVLCHEVFTQGSHLRRHYVMNCSESNVACGNGIVTKDEVGIVTKDEVGIDEDIHGMDCEFVCNICQKGFAGEAKLKRHTTTHNREHRFQCQKCSKSFMRRAHLLKHEITHTDVWPVSCSICNKGFHTSTELEEHNGTHTGILPHVCHVCGKRFALLETLKRHELVHLAKKTFQCKKCDKSFKCLSYLKSHQKWHDGIKPFMCDVCGKGFLGSSNLKTHRRIHTGERPYKCSHCDKSFLQICAVKEHEKIHLGEKQFVCDTCGKMFMTYAQLYNHLKIHIGIKAFECEICKKRFFTNGDMTKHQRIHKDQRPFVCQVCGKGFKYSSNLHGHARIHSGDRPYQCKTCHKAFTYSSHLSRHNKLHMREKLMSEEKECEPLPTTLLNNQVNVSHVPLYPMYVDEHTAADLQPTFPVYTGFDINLSSV